MFANGKEGQLMRTFTLSTCIAPSFVTSYGFNTIPDITHVVVSQLLLNLSAVGLLHLPQAQLQHNRGCSEESILAEDVAVNEKAENASWSRRFSFVAVP